MSKLRPLLPAPPLMHHCGKRLRRAASAADRLSLPSRGLFQLQEMHACFKSHDTVRALLVHVQVTSCSCMLHAAVAASPIAAAPVFSVVLLKPAKRCLMRCGTRRKTSAASQCARLQANAECATVSWRLLHTLQT
jgi:hypothetical protein